MWNPKSSNLRYSISCYLVYCPFPFEIQTLNVYQKKKNF